MFGACLCFWGIWFLKIVFFIKRKDFYILGGVFKSAATWSVADAHPSYTQEGGGCCLLLMGMFYMVCVLRGRFQCNMKFNCGYFGWLQCLRRTLIVVLCAFVIPEYRVSCSNGLFV